MMMLCNASSAAMVEIRAGLLALQWACAQGLPEVFIQTDCITLVLCNLSGTEISLQDALMDFCSLCSYFNAVKVIKVDRHLVKAAHFKARAASAGL